MQWVYPGNFANVKRQASQKFNIKNSSMIIQTLTTPTTIIKYRHNNSHTTLAQYTALAFQVHINMKNNNVIYSHIFKKHSDQHITASTSLLLPVKSYDHTYRSLNQPTVINKYCSWKTSVLGIINYHIIWLRIQLVMSKLLIKYPQSD